MNEELAEETGIHVGDGSMNIYNGVSCYTLACHHIDDREYIDSFVVPLFKRVYGILPKARNRSKGAYGFRIHNSKIVDFKNKQLCLPLGKKSLIEVPESIRYCPRLFKAFLRGFVDTDGGINTFLANKKDVYPRIELSNVSYDLMLQVYVFLKELGFRVAFWNVDANVANWRAYSRMSINGFEMLAKWKKEIGFHNPKNIRKLKELGI